MLYSRTLDRRLTFLFGACFEDVVITSLVVAGRPIVHIWDWNWCPFSSWLFCPFLAWSTVGFLVGAEGFLLLISEHVVAPMNYVRGGDK